MNAPVTVVQKKNERSSSQNTPSEIRVAYPYFHEKRTKDSAGKLFISKKTGQPNPRYSASLMFPKLSNDASTCANYMFLWGLAIEAAKKMWPQNVDQAGNWVWPAGAQYAVKDGDVPFVSKPKPGQPVPSAEEIAKKNAWRRGYWIIETENFLDPGPRIAKVINGVAVELPAKVINGISQYKSGDFGFANIQAFAYENETFGVKFGIDGFCFTREGEAIGSSGPKSASQMFGSVATFAAPGGAPGGAPALPTAVPAVASPAIAPSAIAPVPMPTVSAGPSSLPPLPPTNPSVGPAPSMAPSLPPIPGR